MRHPTAIWAIVIVIAALSFGTYEMYGTYAAAKAAADAADAQSARIAETRDHINRALSSVAGITPADLNNGFWFTFTDADGEYVYYFDPASLAAAGISDAELQTIVSRLRTSAITTKSSMRDVPNSELSPALQFHNSLYAFDQSGSFITVEKALEKSVQAASTSSDTLFKLSYISELKGNYTERDALDARNCKEFKQRCASDKSVVHITGKVIDEKGMPVQGASISVLSRTDVAPVASDAKGMYTVAVPVNDLEKIRLHILKRNYSDGIASIVIVSKGKTTYQVPDTTLSAPITIVTIDTDKHTVTGDWNKSGPDGSFEIHTAQSKYQIPAGALVHADGKPYHGQLDIYLYEFTRGTVPQSLATIDTFDQVVGYAGDLMKSFGMPYIQFFAPTGEEIHVLNTNPMILTYTIANMDDLRNNTAHIYRALTVADMQLLVAASVGQPYHIDRQFLIDHQLLQFPAFWVFDRRVGVWQNVGISVLDLDGTIQSKFYTMTARN